MNVENLKLILEALSGIAGSTKEAFIWYLCATSGIALLQTALGWCGGLFILRTLFVYIARPLFILNSSIAYLMSIRDKHGLGTSGILSDDELSRVRGKIDAALGESRK